MNKKLKTLIKFDLKLMFDSLKGILLVFLVVFFLNGGRGREEFVINPTINIFVYLIVSLISGSMDIAKKRTNINKLIGSVPVEEDIKIMSKYINTFILFFGLFISTHFSLINTSINTILAFLGFPLILLTLNHLMDFLAGLNGLFPGVLGVVIVMFTPSSSVTFDAVGKAVYSQAWYIDLTNWLLNLKNGYLLFIIGMLAYIGSYFLVRKYYRPRDIE